MGEVPVTIRCRAEDDTQREFPVAASLWRGVVCRCGATLGVFPEIHDGLVHRYAAAGSILACDD